MEETDSLADARQIFADGAEMCEQSLLPPPPPPTPEPAAGPSCTSYTEFQNYVDAVNPACCNQASQDCSSGLPSTCNMECSDILVPMSISCSSFLTSNGMGDTLSQINSAAATCSGQQDGVVITTTPASGAGVTQQIEAPYSPMTFTFSVEPGATYEVSVTDLDSFDSILVLLDCDGHTVLAENDDATDGTVGDDGYTHSLVTWTPSIACPAIGAPMNNGGTSRGSYMIQVEDGYEEEGFFILTVVMASSPGGGGH